MAKSETGQQQGRSQSQPAQGQRGQGQTGQSGEMKCTSCDRSFNSQQDLREHERKMHGGQSAS